MKRYKHLLTFIEGLDATDLTNLKELSVMSLEELDKLRDRAEEKKQKHGARLIVAAKLVKRLRVLGLLA